ncbi:MAG TPA: hypothetical protein VFE47_09665 [Tepidisphaeraceae bacterium]|jgi:tetratricopeptide (TPR) repeat protein|nr:hypothetical protein [Tepidisphaeraceae bacterium]
MRKPRGLSASGFILVALAMALLTTSWSLAVDPPATEPASASRPATEPSPAHGEPVSATQPAVSPEIASLIDTLDDPDPATRDAAAKKLVAMGRAAFTGLSGATHSDIPEIRLRAAALLKKLPWDMPDDPPGVARILSGYGTLAPDRRRRIVELLANVQGPESAGAWRVIGRILAYETDQSVQWKVATQLRLHGMGKNLGLPRQTVAGMSLPMKVIAGRTNLRRHPQLAVNLLLQAVKEDLQSPHPAADRSEIIEVVFELAKVARKDHHEAIAADLIRQQYPLATAAQRTSLARELYALHADGGPLPGLADDLTARPPNLADRPTLYALARLDERMGHHFSALIIDRLALNRPAWTRMLVGGNDAALAYDRVEVARFLLSHDWTDPAEREMDALLREAAADDVVSRLNAHFCLATVARLRRDDLALAANMKSAIALIEASPQKITLTGDPATRLVPDEMDNLRATMEMAYFHAAKKAGHDAGMQTHAIALGKLRPINGPLLLEIYPVLIKAGDEADAVATFDATFLGIKNLVAAEGADPDPNAMNELAWICAQCNHHLDVAEEMARSAVAKMPDRGAYVDTLAEVEFRLGRVNQAVELETKAMKLLPKDEQIRANLARYQAAEGAATKPVP